MKKIILLIFLLNLYSAISQEIDRELDNKIINYFEKSNKIKNAIYFDFKISFPGNEIFISKTKFYNQIYSYKIHEKYTTIDKFDTNKLKINQLMTSPLSFTFESRFNVISRSNYSISAKLPLTLGVGLCLPSFTSQIGGTGDNGDWYTSTKVRKWGFFNINIPLLFGYAKNLNSTYTNSSKNGYSINFGGQILLMPLIKGEAINLNNNGKSIKAQKIYYSPLIGYDYYWFSKKNKIKGISILVSPLPIYFKFSYVFVSKLKILKYNI